MQGLAAVGHTVVQRGTSGAALEAWAGVVVVPQVLEELRRPPPGALEALAVGAAARAVAVGLLQLAARVALAVAEAAPAV